MTVHYSFVCTTVTVTINATASTYEYLILQIPDRKYFVFSLEIIHFNLCHLLL